VPVGTVGTADANRIAQFQTGTSIGGTVTLAAPRRAPGVTVSNESTRGELGVPTPQGTITVASSTDLNALATALAAASFGENIEVNDSTFTRSGSGVNIDAGDALERTLSLSRTTIAADIIKARSFNTAGRDALVIDGSRFDAARLIRLYADGESTLRFKGDVQLKSPLIHLAGKTVTIDAGGRVRADGNVTVYSDNHAYDLPGKGTLEAGSKSRADFSQRPRY
jgi:hypothetical protein